MILTLARIVGVLEKGAALVDRLQADLRAIAVSAERFPRRPHVFFEEWNDPLITGIRWVEELIEIAGGESLFPELRKQQSAKNRIVDASVVAQRDPQIVIASWCGKKVSKPVIRAREGWAETSAVRGDHIYEVKSTYILQPGPAALSEGIRQLHAIIAGVLGLEVSPELRPTERMDTDLVRTEAAK